MCKIPPDFEKEKVFLYSKSMKTLLCLFCFSISSFSLCLENQEATSPADENLEGKISGAVNAYLGAYKIPGAVVLIGHGDNISFHQAYGTINGQRPMPKEALFDLASITKVFTAAALLKKLEAEGLNHRRLLGDILSPYKRRRTQSLALEDLLRHESGMRAGVGGGVFADNERETWKNIFAINPSFPRGEFKYSDVNYLVLGKVLERLSGRALDQAVKELILKPLDMNSSGFLPMENIPDCAGLCAPTNRAWPLGEVHDPTSKRLGGIAGHAGLFASAKDLAKFASLFLNSGRYCEKRILSSRQVRVMTQKQSQSSRGLGFDIDSRFSENPRGEGFAKGLSFGHTGYTGTSLWIDPTIDTFLVVLSNPVYAKDWKKAKKGLLRMIYDLAGVVGDGFGISLASDSMTGLDKLH